ncbi:MAG TPA: hypothetical protein PK668_09265 [Myxococcota bacterium]|nr:hypothetical protein [Myxococcota bacterium]HRY92830.1 hypothetical protein [Myxococcota bacterium]HSA20275.1 hypothetical protein [Myxococcota bacterium]
MPARRPLQGFHGFAALAWLCAGASAALAAEPLELRFALNPLPAFLVFVETARGDSMRSTTLREAFERSRQATPEVRAQLAAILDEAPSLRESIVFQSYPEARRQARMLPELMLLAAAQARDLDDLELRCRGLLPFPEHARLFATYRALYPIYLEALWEPHRGELATFQARLEARARQADLAGILGAARELIGAEWPPGVPFEVRLYPIPGRQGHSISMSSANLETLGVLTDKEDVDGILGILVHEACHSLWDAQPLERQRELDARFAANPSPYARYAYRLLNEGLAAAVGNGETYARLTGRLDEDPWYNEATIEGYARALYPLVHDYLTRGRRLDAAFVDQAVARFAGRFPEAIYRFDNLLTDVLLLCDGDALDTRRVGQALRARFRINSFSRMAPAGGPDALAALAEARSSTVVLAISEGQLGQLARAVDALPVLQPHRERLLAPGGELAFAALEPDGRAILVLRVRDLDGLQRLVERLLRAERLRPGQPFLE